MIVEGKVALVTGAARSLGKAYAQALLDKGAKVCVMNILESEGIATVQEFQSRYGVDRAIFIKCDITDKDQLEAAFKKTVNELGGLDIVVNNAGVFDAPDQCIIDVNVTATVQGTYLAVDHLSREKESQGGVIINICSTAGFTTRIGARPSYIGSKYFVYGFTKTYGTTLALGQSGIRLNMLCPPYVADTTMSMEDKEMLDQDGDSPLHIYFKHFGGWVSKEDMAKGLVRLVEEHEHQGAAVLVTSGGQEFITPTKHWD